MVQIADDREIRLRCIEAAARNPTPNSAGFAAGVLEAAKQWEAWICQRGVTVTTTTLGVPKKGS